MHLLTFSWRSTFRDSAPIIGSSVSDPLSVNVSLTSELSEYNFRIALCVFDIVAYHIFTAELTRLKNVISCLYRFVIVCFTRCFGAKLVDEIFYKYWFHKYRRIFTRSFLRLIISRTAPQRIKIKSPKNCELLSARTTMWW